MFATITVWHLVAAMAIGILLGGGSMLVLTAPFLRKHISIYVMTEQDNAG